MALNKDPKPDFEVTVDIPLASGGVEKLKAQCHWMMASAYREVVSELNGTAENEAEVLTKLYKHWDSEVFPCDKAGIKDLVDFYPSAGNALFRAYRETLFEGRRKN